MEKKWGWRWGKNWMKKQSKSKRESYFFVRRHVSNGGGLDNGLIDTLHQDPVTCWHSVHLHFVPVHNKHSHTAYHLLRECYRSYHSQCVCVCWMPQIYLLFIVHKHCPNSHTMLHLWDPVQALNEWMSTITTNKAWEKTFRKRPLLQGHKH